MRLEIKYLILSTQPQLLSYTAVENKIPDHSKHIATSKLAAETFAARLAQANLESKNDIVNFEKK